jgi:LCP family protein required for cell wall assembly
MNPFLGQLPLDDLPSRRSWGQRLVLCFNAVLIAASLGIAGLLDYANDRASSINRVALDRSLTERPGGEPGSRVMNVLLVGSDSSANLDPDDPIQIGRQGERLGDVIIVAHVDERSGDVALLSLPRDLWVPLSGTDRDDRINRAFLVGGAGTLIDTIEEAFDIPIHHYVNVDFAGFQGLVEAVGTVDVYFDAPARDWNVNAQPEPRSQTGFRVDTAGCHALDAEQALAYVRSRYYQIQRPDGTWVTDPTSDLGRIRRQQDFLQRLLQQAIELGARNPLVLGDLVDAGLQNVAIDQDLTPSLLVDLSDTYRSFEPGDLQTYTFPVTDGTVGANRVLIPQMAQAEPVLALFQGERFNAPSTVGLEVVYDPSLAPDAGPTRLPEVVRSLAVELRAAGFEVERPRPAATDGGVFIRHGPDGHQAAELVRSVVEGIVLRSSSSGAGPGSSPVLEQTTGLSGRNVVLALGSGVADADTELLAGPAWELGAPSGPDDGAAVPGDGAAVPAADGGAAPEVVAAPAVAPAASAPVSDAPGSPADVSGPVVDHHATGPDGPVVGSNACN